MKSKSMKSQYLKQIMHLEQKVSHFQSCIDREEFSKLIYVTESDIAPLVELREKISCKSDIDAGIEELFLEALSAMNGEELISLLTSRMKSIKNQASCHAEWSKITLATRDVQDIARVLAYNAKLFECDIVSTAQKSMVH